MRRMHLVILVTLGLYGCSLSGLQTEPNQQASSSAFSGRSAEALYNLPAPERSINFYVRGLMQNLILNMQFVNESTPVAVTSFVMLNSDFRETNLLGNQISESMIHEIHKFGIPVIDFKTSSAIETNAQGDYIFSRDPKKLKQDLPIHYVFGGTMVKHQGGYLLNARVVGLKSKAVVASAQSFIPSDVSKALIDQGRKQNNKARKTIKLVQGS